MVQAYVVATVLLHFCWNKRCCLESLYKCIPAAWVLVFGLSFVRLFRSWLSFSSITGRCLLILLLVLWKTTISGCHALLYNVTTSHSASVVFSQFTAITPPSLTATGLCVRNSWKFTDLCLPPFQHGVSHIHATGCIVSYTGLIPKHVSILQRDVVIVEM